MKSLSTPYPILIYFLLFSFLSCHSSVHTQKPQAIKGVLDLRGWDFSTDGPVNLDGEWEFYWNQLYSDLNLKDSFLKHEFRTIPDNWNKSANKYKKHPSFGFATYRLRLLLNSQQKLSFKILDAATSYTFYVNNQIALVNGKVSRNRNDYLPEYKPKVSGTIILQTDNEIVIEVANFLHSKGGLWKSIQLGDTETLQKKKGKWQSG